MSEPPAAFDAARYEREQRRRWNQDGAAWRRRSPALNGWYGGVTGQMLDPARIRPGRRVLDFASPLGLPGQQRGWRPPECADAPARERSGPARGRRPRRRERGGR